MTNSSTKDQQESSATSERWQELIKPKPFIAPTAEEIELRYGDAFIADYQRMFSQYCWRSPHFDLMTLHVIIGQLSFVKPIKIKVKKTWIDLRMFGCLFQDSGSGKGRGFDFTNDVTALLKLNYQPITEVTDSALIGRYEKVEEWESGKGKKRELILEEGVLHPGQGVNIVAMEEADLLFSQRPSQHAKNAMSYYQTTMNAHGSSANLIAKKLAVGPFVEFHPSASFLFTTYYPENLMEIIIRRGFLQRMMVVINEVSTEDRAASAEESVNYLEEDEEYELTLQDIADRLLVVNEFFKGTKRLKLEAGVKDGFRVVVGDLFDAIRDITRLPRKKLEEFIHRWLEISYRLAYHHAILRLSHTVEVQDVVYAKNYVIPLWQKVIALIEDALTEEGASKAKRQNNMKTIIDAHHSLSKARFKDGFVPEVTLLRLVSMYMDVSRNVARKRIDEAAEEGILVRVKRGMVDLVKLGEKKRPFDNIQKL